MTDIRKSRRALLKGAAIAASAVATSSATNNSAQAQAIENTIKPGVDTDIPVFRFRQPDGSVVGVPITPDVLKREPALNELLGRLRSNSPAAATYGETYEKGPSHDKEHSKSGDHGKGFSRT